MKQFKFTKLDKNLNGYYVADEGGMNHLHTDGTAGGWTFSKGYFKTKTAAETALRKYNAKFKPKAVKKSKELSLPEQIALAKSYLSKTVIDKDGAKFKVETFGVYIDGAPKTGQESYVVTTYAKKNGVCVFVFGGISVPVTTIKSIVKDISVKLNDSYTAVITEKGIKVGCQTFPLSIVEELAKAIKTIK